MVLQYFNFNSTNIFHTNRQDAVCMLFGLPPHKPSTYPFHVQKLTIRYANEVFFYHYLEDIQTMQLSCHRLLYTNLINSQSARYICGNGCFGDTPVEIRSTCSFRSIYYASEILHTYVYLLTDTSLHAAKGRLGELRNVDLGEGIFTDVQRIYE